ncbi:MAG TPA: CYTH and CHAD domain-containing protein [Gaiellaceae bacterium]|nr:CYTH and CHAD domain-containing protein [Gaiellaceae bacterium]
MDVTAEHERKLDAPDGFELPQLGGSPLETRVFTSVYHDVADGSLARSGITLRRRTERGRSVWQLKLPSEDARLELEQPGGPGDPPQELRKLLAAHLRHGPVAPVAELRTRRRGQLVARNGTTAEVTIDEVAVMDALRVSDEFVEVEIELRTGDPARLDDIAEEVERAGAVPSGGLPKLFRALGLTGPPPAPKEPFEALRALLQVQLTEILRHDPGTRLGTDPESLHDMRVAVRRSRALLRAGRRLIAGDTDELNAELQWLGSVLGAVRDLDVLLGRLHEEAAGLGGDDTKAAEQLLRALERERRRDRTALLRALGSARYLKLLDRFQAELDALEPSGDDVPLDALARRELKKLRKAVRALPEEPHDDELHRVRKLGKRARYASELAGRAGVVRRAKALQDVLGEHQDAVVAEERLRALAAEATPEQALAAGRLVDRERIRRAETRAAWPAVWRKLKHASR